MKNFFMRCFFDGDSLATGNKEQVLVFVLTVSKSLAFSKIFLRPDGEVLGKSQSFWFANPFLLIASPMGIVVRGSFIVASNEVFGQGLIVVDT